MLGMSRAWPLAVVAALAILGGGPSVHALERTSAAADREQAWSLGGTCTVSYFNDCTGWVYGWSAWSPEDRFGVRFDACCATTTLETSSFFAQTGAPAGYGYTGTIDVCTVDASGCPTGTVATQSFRPASGWNLHNWSVSVPSQFALVVTMGPASFNPAVFASDHPAAGPTGPAACGTCYPTTRVGRSFYWGKVNSPQCPGVVLSDGTCDAEFLVQASMACAVSVGEGVRGEAWARVKGMYR